jgi:hypothetical protein
MYLWRNLPEGQLLAVLRWMQVRREASRLPAPGDSSADTSVRPPEPGEVTTR